MHAIASTAKRKRLPVVVAEFDVATFLGSAGAARVIAKHTKGTVIFAQGDAAAQVMYIQHGSVKMSVPRATSASRRT